MRSTRPAWWPILEKAYAVALGGYNVLDLGGTPHGALHMITGYRRDIEFWRLTASRNTGVNLRLCSAQVRPL